MGDRDLGVFEHSEYRDHEHVAFVGDEATGLRAIIAIHSTVLGPGGGGIRFFPYASSDEALGDVLRLSRAMTLKMALAGIPFGGGKAVIIGDPKADKTEPLLEAFGRAMDALEGRFVCGEDVGTTPEDMAVIHRQTPHVAGRPDTTGDTSPTTGEGVFNAIRAAVAHRWGRDDLSGLKVAVQGVGNVGSFLCGHLAGRGAEIFVTDVNEAAVDRAAQRFGATAVPPEAILGLDVDVLAPCALGGIFDDRTIPEIKAKVVCGGANNQLAEDRHAEALAARDILYVPDFLANAGGVISGTSPFLGRDASDVAAGVAAIYDTCARLLDLAATEAITPNAAAERLVEEAIVARRGERWQPDAS